MCRTRMLNLATRCLPLVLTGLMWCVLGGSAEAQMRGFGGFGGGYGYGGWWTGLPYGFAQQQQELPYFSKYPPVYYSHPVPRPYGYSPFAYPPGYTTPEPQQAPAPSDIENPFVPQQQTKPTSDRTAASTGPTPKVILNPYVDQVELTADP